MTDRKPEKTVPDMQSVTTARTNSARLGRDVQKKIGQQLRAMYDDVVNQGVPDRFADLLRKLDEREEEKPSEAPGQDVR
jgi:hypothetical protein